MTVTLTYDATLARVRVAATDAFTAEYIVIQRQSNGVTWTTVRGATRLDAAGGVSIDDYEFDPNVINTYRARSYSAADSLLGTQSNTITPTIDRVWLKSVARPFLNTPIVVQDYAPISRSGRSGLFAVPGRSYPVRVGDVASSRSWSMTILTSTLTESRSVEYLVASGDVLNLQVPPSYDIPGGYVDVGQMTLARRSRTLADDRRLVTLPLTEIAAPSPNIVGYTATWAGLIAEFGTWADVLAAFPTWADVLEYVSDPSIVVVP